MKRKKLTKAERMQVYEKCNGHCAYCGCELEYKAMQIDHVKPLRIGGEDELSNMLPACRSCNHYKATLGVEGFRKYLAGMEQRLMRDSVPFQVAMRFGMDREILCRAKRIDNGEWVQGYYFTFKEKLYISNIGQTFIHAYYTEESVVDFNMRAFEIEPSTISRCTGKEYMDSETAYEGDIFVSQSCGLIMALRYGTYQAYCPADKCYMDNVGFYAEAEGYPQMPIGDLSDYALKIGNIFDNPELLKAGTEG